MLTLTNPPIPCDLLCDCEIFGKLRLTFVSSSSLPTCISLTVQVKVASWPTSTVMFFMSSTNRGFIPAPTADTTQNS